ncbi:MAG: DnaD domain protein, partial [Clostridia bacterium]|nr:DnaD domain protein [Clostridia bacterium]
MAEIDAVASRSKVVSGLFYQAEKVLDKVLTQSDMEMLYSFVDWLGLPVEVITMLLSYAVKCGKTGRRYLETVAIDWAERGIDNFEAAEAFVRELEQRDSKEWKIRSILGIYDRALTATEKKYISQWIEDETISLDLVPLAYDKTISNTGKLSYAYMNKILLSWATEGFSTEAEVEKWDGKPAKVGKTVPKKSKFNNYEDTNSVNYDMLEEQLLDMMLDD